MFVAFAGRNVGGAKWFGYPGFWVNRLSYPGEELDAIPGDIGNNYDRPR